MALPVYCVFLMTRHSNGLVEEYLEGVFTSLPNANTYCSGSNNEHCMYNPIVCGTRANTATLFQEGTYFVIEEMVPS
jgi:hypothetical protein